jgi:hypothetical protein
VQVTGMLPVLEFYRKWHQPIEGMRMRWVENAGNVHDLWNQCSYQFDKRSIDRRRIRSL